MSDTESDNSRMLWARAVADEVSRLPHDQATAVRLVYNERLSLREAAAVLRVRVDRVGAILADALRSIAAALDGSW